MLLYFTSFNGELTKETTGEVELLDGVLRRRDVNKGDVGVAGAGAGTAKFGTLLPSIKLDGESIISCLILMAWKFTGNSLSVSTCTKDNLSLVRGGGYSFH